MGLFDTYELKELRVRTDAEKMNCMTLSVYAVNEKNIRLYMTLVVFFQIGCEFMVSPFSTDVHFMREKAKEGFQSFNSKMRIFAQFF